MKKLCNIVMLPTERAVAGNIGFSVENNKLFIISEENTTYMNDPEGDGLNIPQHLYIVSDEDIYKDDWITDGRVVTQVKLSEVDACWGKVRASTDKSILIKVLKEEHSDGRKVYADKIIPQISQSFIKDFIKSNGTIKKVLVEYSEYESHPLSPNFEKWIHIKTNPDNTIIIHLQEKLPTTLSIKMNSEEIEKLHLRFLSDRRIATLQNEIAAIYNISVPKGIVKSDGIATLVYDEKVNFEVKRIESIITDIVKTEYTELVLDEEK